MKKALTIVLALALSLALVGPVLANNGQDVETNVTVIGGGGSSPVIKCKWETAWTWANGDDDLTKDGLQVDLSVIPQGSKTVYYWAVAADPNFDVSKVWADVYEPCDVFKYQVQLDQIYCDTPVWAVADLELADAAGLITYGPGHDLASVSQQLLDEQAKMYKGQADLEHPQPGGYYHVQDRAQDASGNLSAILLNCFEYVRTPAIELDFTKIDFGEVPISTEVIISGDDIMDPVDTGPRTIKNSGNCNLDISVHFDDMGLKPPEGDVEFDAQLDLCGKVIGIKPSVPTKLTGELPICNAYPMHFSIHIIKALELKAYSGKVTITGQDNLAPDGCDPCENVDCPTPPMP